jgi:hypothetical protein
MSIAAASMALATISGSGGSAPQVRKPPRMRQAVARADGNARPEPR